MIKSENGKTLIAGTEAEIFHDFCEIYRTYFGKIAKEKSVFSAQLHMDQVKREVERH